MKIFGTTEARGTNGARLFVHERWVPRVRETMDALSVNGKPSVNWHEEKLKGWEFSGSTARACEAMKALGFIEKPISEVMGASGPRRW